MAPARCLRALSPAFRDGLAGLVISLLLLCLPRAARAQVITSFQDGVSPTAGYAGTRDTWLDEFNPTTNRGTSTILELDTNMSAIVKWDTSTIPAGSTVTAASITVRVTNPSSEVYEVYEMLRNWVEMQVTWNVYATGSSWATAGAQGPTDRGTTVLGTITGGTGTRTVTLNSSGVALVQSWVDNPAGNFGVIFQDYANSNGLDFYSRERTPSSERPILTVTYTLSRGSTCTVGSACTSTFCVDDFCCDLACGGGSASDCQACSVAAGAAMNGTCANLTAGTTCRASAGTCDVAETCSGASASCPADAFAAGTTCRPSAGACDVAETCSGASASCPANAASPNGTICSDGNECTMGESCQNGSCGAPSSSVICTALSDCHDVGLCNPATGFCSTPRKPDGTPCPQLGFCASGLCIPAPPVEPGIDVVAGDPALEAAPPEMSPIDGPQAEASADQSAGDDGSGGGELPGSDADSAEAGQAEGPGTSPAADTGISDDAPAAADMFSGRLLGSGGCSCETGRRAVSVSGGVFPLILVALAVATLRRAHRRRRGGARLTRVPVIR